MKKIKVENNGTIAYHLVRYMAEIAKDKSMDLFSVWFVEKIIIPYKQSDKVIDRITEMIGFKKVPTIDKIYFRLKEITF